MTPASSVKSPIRRSWNRNSTIDTQTMKAMLYQPIRHTDASARSGRDAPRFWPTSVAPALDMPHAGISVNTPGPLPTGSAQVGVLLQPVVDRLQVPVEGRLGVLRPLLGVECELVGAPRALGLGDELRSRQHDHDDGDRA